MTIVAQAFDYVIGADTHARTHTVCITATGTGEILGTRTFPTSPAGLSRCCRWVQTSASGRVLAAVEGTRSYGAELTRVLSGAGIEVVEVKPPRRRSRSAKGKSDEIDAQAAVQAVMSEPVEQLAVPRSDGVREAMRVLLASRRTSDTHRTGLRSALTVLARTHDLGIDARRALTMAQVREVSRWRAREIDRLEVAVIRAEAKDMATQICAEYQRIETIDTQLQQLVQQMCPGLLDIFGVGPVVAANLLCAYSHKGRIHSEAAFAKMAGIAPIPASSGNTVRWRLNRFGDRQLNQAVDTIVRVRIMHEERTQNYVKRRTEEGKTNREIRRMLRRYVAREIYRSLQALMP